MRISTETWRPDARPARCLLIGLAACFLFAVTAPSSAQESPARLTSPTASPEARVLVDNALGFLRNEQAPDGSFGSDQPRLAAAASVLAFCSASGEWSNEDRERVERAVDYLIRSASPNGELGDNLFSVESHALATAAILAAGARMKDPVRTAAVATAGETAVRQLQRLQDRGGAAGSRGGWKMETSGSRENDRRATAWALWALASARLHGLETRRADLDRAVRFVTASLKETSERADEVGGLSVDAEGLAVASTSAMGGWVLARHRPGTGPARLNLAWLARHPPQWSGPTYFYTGFFHLRALRLADASGKVFADHHRRVMLQLREHQLGDGSVALPPGEAQNFVAMGRVFSTAMAVLLVQAGDSRLVGDEDYRAAIGF